MEASRRGSWVFVTGLLAAMALVLAGCGSAGVDGSFAGPGGPGGGGGGGGTGLAILSWDANDEPDLGGYRVYYGLAPGVYQSAIDVGLATTATVTSLETGNRYYFAVTAYDTSGNESGYSTEVFKDVM